MCICSVRKQDFVHYGGFDVMKRWLAVSCLVLISALGVLVPAGAQAGALATTKLTSGKPVKATISKPGQTVKYTFAAKKNKNVTFQVTKFDFTDNGSAGSAYLYFYEPDSSTDYTYAYFTANATCGPFTTPVGGTWTATLVPYAASVGILKLALT
jgi:hypothetical protein